MGSTWGCRQGERFPCHTAGCPRCTRALAEPSCSALSLNSNLWILSVTVSFSTTALVRCLDSNFKNQTAHTT